jgi:hypothetical protein
VTVDAAPTLAGALTLEIGPEPERPVVAWDDLRHGRERIANEVLEAAALLIAEDLPHLVQALSGKKRSSVATVALFLRELWTDEVGVAWLTTATTRSMLALGMQMWLRRIAETSRTREESVARLRLMQSASSSHTATNVGALWWEALSIAGRFAWKTAPGEFVSALYEVAADVIATSGQIPTDDVLATYGRTNSATAAVLPYAAFQAAKDGNDDIATRADNAFRREIERVVTTADAHLSMELITGHLYLESCSLAIMYSSDADWWVRIVRRALGDDRPWRVQPSREHVWKAAWLLSAAAIAVDRMLREAGQRRMDILEMITTMLDRYLSLLFWEDSYGQRDFWRYLASVLSRALSIDALNGPARIAQLAREVRSPEMMCAVLTAGGPLLDSVDLQTLVDLLRARMDFSLELRSDSPPRR